MSDTMVEYEALYRETGNPLYAWEAFGQCRRDQPIPGWIFDYLRSCAYGRSSADYSPPRRLPVFQEGDGILTLASRCRAIRNALGDVAKRDAERKAYRNRPDGRKLNEECERLDAEYAHSMQNAASQAADRVARALGIRSGANFNAFEDKLKHEDRAAKAFYLDHARQRKAWAKIQGDMEKQGDHTGASRQQIYKDAATARELWAAQRRAKGDPEAS
jgi:hypothetical protein